MKRVLIGIIGLSLLLVAAAANARPGGMGRGMGMGPNADLSPEQQQFFDVTRDLRKEMHEKRFDLRELYRTNADQAKIVAVQAEIDAIRAKIQDKAKDLNITSGPGACRNQGADCFACQAERCDDQKPCCRQIARGCGNMGRCAQ
jgi:hypothetical protein